MSDDSGTAGIAMATGSSPKYIGGMCKHTYLYEPYFAHLPRENMYINEYVPTYSSSDSGDKNIDFQQDGESWDSIADGVNFNNAPLEPQEEKALKLKRNREIDQENKRVAAEDYNEEIREKHYKRFMHLLDRSQFYSQYLCKKIDQSMQKEQKKSPEKRRTRIRDENLSPNKKSKRVIRDKGSYDIREFVNLKNVKTGKSKLNLSQEEIAAELEASEPEPSENRTNADAIPLKYFDGILRDYQIDGLKWLQVLYENGLNGILADEMGLGKTIQVIALLCHLIEKKVPGPYLIVAPLSTLPNWLSEFERFAPMIPVVLLHGPPLDRIKLHKKIRQKYFSIEGYKTHPVVLTTFEVPLQEASFLRLQQWRYIIIDEGHRIKNHECQLIRVLKSCQSMNRLLLTGTPLQNNLAELWSLLNFLLPDIFDDLAVFESWFDAKELQDAKGTQRILQQEADKQVLLKLREILKPFMLRRVKTDVCLEIPAKKEIIVYAPLTELQHSLYRAVLNRDIQMLTKIDTGPAIIADVNGKRPKRRARIRAERAMGWDDDSKSDQSSSRGSTPIDDEDIGSWKKDSLVGNNDLSAWKQFSSADERNQEFLVQTQFVQRGVMYKKIVNHPYLVHCPLDDVGLPRIDEELVKSSGKLLVLDAMLKKLNARGHKVLIFSTWTMILDMIEDYAMMRDYLFERLDGRCKIESRKNSIASFNSNPDVFLFLVSTRAGGVGLNLTGADTVIIYDSDWNPQADIQAMARCHRIGQTRPVVIYKLCTKGTIDESIINRATAKRKLEKMVISEDLSKNLNNVDTLVKLRELLDSTENLIVKAEHNVFTHKELDELLDRSDLMAKNTTV